MSDPGSQLNTIVTDQACPIPMGMALPDSSSLPQEDSAPRRTTKSARERLEIERKAFTQPPNSPHPHSDKVHPGCTRASLTHKRPQDLHPVYRHQRASSEVQGPCPDTVGFNNGAEGCVLQKGQTHRLAAYSISQNSCFGCFSI